MNLYRISQEQETGYDTYDSAIVCAPDAETAKTITPDGRAFECNWNSWCSSPESVEVELIGEAVEGSEQGVELASFNAG